MTRFRSRSIGLPLGEQLLLGALIEAVHLADGSTLVLSNDPDARIVFVNSQSQIGFQFLQTVPAVCYVVVVGGTQKLNNPHFHLEQPIRLKSLSETVAILINRIRNEHHDLAHYTTSGAEKAVAPHQLLERALSLVDAAERIPEGCRLDCTTALEVMFWPQHNQVELRSKAGEWSDALLKDFAANSHLVPVRNLEPGKAELLMSFEQFRWRLAHVLSNGVLLSGLSDRVIFGLKRWPDLALIGNEPHAMKLSALLAIRPVTLGQMCSIAKMSREQAIAFINACASIGLIELASSPIKVWSDTHRPDEVAPRSAVSSSPNLKVTTGEIAKSAPPQSGFFGFLSKLRSALRAGH